MPAAIRKSVDPSLGHCYPPRPADTGSENVFVNVTQGGDAAVRARPTSEGSTTADSYPSHTCGDDTHGMGLAKKGSPDVFVNHQAFHRNGDAIDCGDTANNGSSNVFINSNQAPGFIDNNPTFNALQDNDLFENHYPDIYQPIPNLTTADKHLHENFDSVEDVQDGLSSVPPGTTITPTSIVESDEELPPPETPPAQNCNDVDNLPSTFNWVTYDSYVPGTPNWATFAEFADDFQLSPNFTVANMTTRAVFKHQFSSNVTQPVGLTQKEILQNMCFHAKTVLEPMLTSYPGFIITSGWRSYSGGSQHNKGQATDLQWPSINGSGSSRNYYDLAQDIRDNTTYDQLILEWGNNPWIHVSSNISNHRKSVLTQRGAGSSSFVSGLHLLG
jgi:hypothetical protein